MRKCFQSWRLLLLIFSAGGIPGGIISGGCKIAAGEDRRRVLFFSEKFFLIFSRARAPARVSSAFSENQGNKKGGYTCRPLFVLFLCRYEITMNVVKPLLLVFFK